MSEVSCRIPSASAKATLSPCQLLQPLLLLSREIVVGQASSQHHERMNHLAALECQNRSSEGGIVQDVAAISNDRRQPVLEPINMLVEDEQAENAPSEARNSVNASCAEFQPFQALADHFVSALVLQSQQSNCGRLNMRPQRHAVNNAVSGVPA